jgi:hypothetical protein
LKPQTGEGPIWRCSLNIFFLSYFVYCGASETLNLCIVCGRKSTSSFRHKMCQYF